MRAHSMWEFTLSVFDNGDVIEDFPLTHAKLGTQIRTIVILLRAYMEDAQYELDTIGMADRERILHMLRLDTWSEEE